MVGAVSLCSCILPCRSERQLLRLTGCGPYPQYFDCLRIAARNWWRLQFTFWLFPKHSFLLGTIREFTTESSHKSRYVRKPSMFLPVLHMEVSALIRQVEHRSQPAVEVSITEKARAQAEENPGYIPATAEEPQRDSKNSYAHGATETDEVGSLQRPTALRTLLGSASTDCLKSLLRRRYPAVIA